MQELPSGICENRILLRPTELSSSQVYCPEIHSQRAYYDTEYINSYFI